MPKRRGGDPGLDRHTERRRWRPAARTFRAVPRPPPESQSAHLTADDRVGLLRAMLLMRAIEERAMNLYRQGKVPGLLLRRLRPGGRLRRRGVGDGGRPTGCASCTATSARTSSAACSRRRILSQYMGREAGITSGRDGNVHFGDYRTGCVGMVSMLPDMMLVADRHGDGVQAAPRGALRADVVRRRLDVARRLPRGDELGGRAAPAGDLRPREQPVRLLDADRPAVRDQPRRARGRLRLPRRHRSTATTSRRCSRPRASRASARSPAAARRSSRPSRCACTATARTTT